MLLIERKVQAEPVVVLVHDRSSFCASYCKSLTPGPNTNTARSESISSVTADGERSIPELLRQLGQEVSKGFRRHDLVGTGLGLSCQASALAVEVRKTLRWQREPRRKVTAQHTPGICNAMRRCRTGTAKSKQLQGTKLSFKWPVRSLVLEEVVDESMI